MTWAEFRPAVDALLAHGDALTPAAEPGLDRLCDWYRSAADADREAARRFTAGSDPLQRLLWTYSHRLADRVSTPADATALRAGLATVSLDDCSTDWRDTLSILAELWVRAERAGLDPRPHFDAAAGLSATSPGPGGMGDKSMRVLLREFGPGYAIVQERRRHATGGAQEPGA